MLQTMSTECSLLRQSFRGAKSAERRTSLNSDENCDVNGNQCYLLNIAANYYEEIELQFKIMHFLGLHLSYSGELFPG